MRKRTFDFFFFDVAKEVVVAVIGNVSEEAGGKKSLKKNECCEIRKRDIF